MTCRLTSRINHSCCPAPHTSSSQMATVLTQATRTIQSWHCLTLSAPDCHACRLTSRINHSCCPNAAYFFKPEGTVVVRAMRTIQSGEQLSISYTDLLQTLDERQQSLMQRYAFKCCCARCTDDSSMPGDWFLDAVAADGRSHLLLQCNGLLPSITLLLLKTSQKLLLTP